jgi:hypothetical protein
MAFQRLCPICKAEPSQPCKSTIGRKMNRFHPERWRQEIPRKDVNQAGARIARKGYE